jgi:hypothetical protein
MTKLLIIGLQLLILRVGMPLSHPLRQSKIDCFGILDDVNLANSIPLTVFIDLLLLSFMQMMYLSTYRPSHFIILFLKFRVRLTVYTQFSCR